MSNTIKNGELDINNVMLGDVNVSSLYLGENKVYPSSTGGWYINPKITIDMDKYSEYETLRQELITLGLNETDSVTIKQITENYVLFTTSGPYIFCTKDAVKEILMNEETFSQEYEFYFGPVSSASPWGHYKALSGSYISDFGTIYGLYANTPDDTKTYEENVSALKVAGVDVVETPVFAFNSIEKLSPDKLFSPTGTDYSSLGDDFAEKYYESIKLCISALNYFTGSDK